jgi:predicted RNase H-like HicB family nuclease
VAEQPLRVQVEEEDDGHWLAEVIELPGALAYEATRDEALAKAETLALRVIADHLEHGERAPALNHLFIAARVSGFRYGHRASSRRCCQSGGRSSAPRARIESWSGQV